MTSILYKYYFSASRKKIFNKEDFFVRFWALLIRQLIPLYYKITFPFQKYGINKKPYEKNIIISLTSFPARIDVVWLSIESILRQTYKPDKIILWLGEEKFTGLNELPVILKKQMKRGLTIEFREDLKPHTKYYHVMKEYPESVVITVDDDIFYPCNMVSELVKFHTQFPDSVICHGARLMSVTHNKFENYNRWLNWHSTIIESNRRFDILPLGVMGVLYPPKVLHSEVFNIDLIKKTSYKADDLWLKAMQLKNHTSAVLTNTYSKAFVGIPESQTITLMGDNVGQQQNDTQLRAINEEFNIIEIYNSLI